MNTFWIVYVLIALLLIFGTACLGMAAEALGDFGSGDTDEALMKGVSAAVCMTLLGGAAFALYYLFL